MATSGILCCACVILVILNVLCRAAEDGRGDVKASIIEQDEEDADFKRFEDRVVSFMKNVRKQAFPFITKAAMGVPLTSPCMKALTKLYGDILALKTWALKLLDSTGKPPGGVLRGTMVMLGDYDECLSIKEPLKPSRGMPSHIVGKYCLTFLHVPPTLLDHLRKFSTGKLKNSSTTERFSDLFDIMSKYKFNGTDIHFRVGICIPSTCSSSDLESMLKYALEDSSMRGEIRSCEVKEEHQLEADQITILTIFGIVASFVLLGTSIDIYFSMRMDSETKNSTQKQSSAIRFLLCFSIPRNMRKLFDEHLEDETYIDIGCLRGITVIFFCFFMVVSSYAFIDEHVFRNFRSSMNYFEFLKEPFFAIIANSMIFVETFFCIAGFLMFYKPVSEVAKTNMNLKKVALLVILRCLVPLLVAIGCFLLLPLLGHGPAWHEVLDRPLAACRKNWWANLLFINNFFEIEEQCLLHTWFLGCLMQLVIIGFIFKHFINKFPRVGLTILILTAIACNVALGVTTVLESLPPSLSMYFIFNMQTVKRITESTFFLPHGHFGPFAVGMITSYWMRRNPQFECKKITSMIIWVCVITVAFLLIFGLYPYHDGREVGITAVVLYSGLHRTAFAAVVAFVLYTCIKGHGGFLNEILSTRHFIVLRKLIYLAYLLYWMVIFFHIGISRERNYLSHYEQISRSLSHVLGTFLLAFLVYILFNGLFTLDQLIPSNEDTENEVTSTISNCSCFKKLFSRGNFHLQDSSMKIYNLGSVATNDVHSVSKIN